MSRVLKNYYSRRYFLKNENTIKTKYNTNKVVLKVTC